jgi:xanthine dehydrogenase accessory factor
VTTNTLSALNAQVSRWHRRGDRIAIAVVVATARSAPRPIGTKMAVNDRGEIAGGVSGGCVEGAVVEIARKVIEGNPPQLATFGIADEEAWGVGLPCGGEITVWVERHAGSRFLEIGEAGGRTVEVTVLEGAERGEKLLLLADGAHTGTLGSPRRDAEALETAGEVIWDEHSVRLGSLFFDVAAPPPRLVVVGAIDVAASLSTLAQAAGWRAYVVDPRSRFATRARFPTAVGVISAWPAEAFAVIGGLDAGTSVVVLSHDPKIDDAALAIALRSPARFVGAMGSRTATAARRERLMDCGLTEKELERLAAPVGLDLGGESNEETALSILAELVAARHERSGGRLAESAGRIHSLAA